MFGHYCFDHPFFEHVPPGARGKWGWDASFMSGFFGAEGRPRGRWRGGRMFEQGDLRYVVLRLLEEKPRHGYEIIKALEERFGGAYAPSPGAVYPTLQLLEDQGYVRAVETDGRKVYHITPEGDRFLDDNRDVLDEILDRVRDTLHDVAGGSMGELNAAFARLAGLTYKQAWRRGPDHPAVARVVEILRRATEEIEREWERPATEAGSGRSD